MLFLIVEKQLIDAEVGESLRLTGQGSSARLLIKDNSGGAVVQRPIRCIRRVKHIKMYEKKATDGGGPSVQGYMIFCRCDG